MTRRSLFMGLGEPWLAAALLNAISWLTLAQPLRAEATAELPDERPISAEERDHWAYKPVPAVEPPLVGTGPWSEHPVDCFLRSAMDARGVSPLPQAGKQTLLRRLSFDLTGLPPSIDLRREFLRDDTPEAYERLVDRLLASPAYGERYAQHWLDLARFAETDGFEHDLLRPNAWRYRDWVIAAIGADMPYDEFLRWQIAGDLLRPGDPQAAIATGFLLCGPDMPDLNLQEERRHVVLNEITSTVGSVVLAMQFGCAQCHDHKFDPIRQHDFYRLRAFFESADIFRDHPVPTAAELAARQAAEAAVDPKFQQAAETRRALEEAGRTRFREENPDVQPTAKQVLAELTDAEREQHAAALEQLKQAPRLPALPLGRVVREGKPAPAHLYLRGDFRQPVGKLACAFPGVLTDGQCDGASVDQQIPPRVALAQWLTTADHPLTARVMVNRIWQWHFGAPLAASASDFGVMGAEQAHPQLLDWLARRFVADGWSLKKMHRLLVTSQAYRAASAPFDRAWSEADSARAREIFARSSAADPYNTLLWRRVAMRLDGEALRDAMLTAGEQLSTRRGGPGVRPPLAAEVSSTLLKDQWIVTPDKEDHRRRSVYLFVRRNLRYPLFDVFDRPDTNASCPQRHESTTATQSLALLNSEFSLESARHLAGVVLRSGAESAGEQVEAAYVRTLSRWPTAQESERGAQFLADQAARLRRDERAADRLTRPSGEVPVDPFQAAALVDFCLALLNANEFVYVD